jgi:RNA polymerase sigma-70 factor, ECF subfamily
MKHPGRSTGAVYLSPPVELYPFDEHYVELLRRGDRATQHHFGVYFGQLLRVKLRSRKLPAHVIQDVQQETFLRVLLAVRMKEVRQPERLGAYVNAVCNNIRFEHYRLLAREEHVDLEAADGPDAAADLEAGMIADERSHSVHVTMKQLSNLDSAVLRGILLDRDKDELCRELSVTREYLRVLTHRAIKTFKDRHKGKKGPYGTKQAAGR